MMQEYEQTVHIEDPVLEKMRQDANLMLKKLIKAMIDKDSLEGKLTIGIDVKLKKEMVKNTDPEIEGDKRPAYTPQFVHKVGSVLQLKDEAKGEMKCEDMELVWDEDEKDFVVRPMTGRDQRTVLDAEYREVNPEPEEVVGIEGSVVPQIEQKDIPFAPVDNYGYENPGEE